MPSFRIFAGLCLAVACLALLPSVSNAKGKGKGKGASCREEKPKSFLVRKSFLDNGMLQPKRHQRAVRWRAQHYGWVDGLNLEKYNDESAISQAANTKFFGLPLRVHQKIVKRLKCVEKALQSSCTGKKSRYVPRAVGGFREANSYRQGEISNHLFGIAIDIDPGRNPCCGCVDPWPTHPACSKKDASVYEKTELPKCWIRTFEKHGFYWLGHDSLQDTMHFEYLADPD